MTTTLLTFEIISRRVFLLPQHDTGRRRTDDSAVDDGHWTVRQFVISADCRGWTWKKNEKIAWIRTGHDRGRH